MKFSIDYNLRIEPRQLVYRIEEGSFDTIPSLLEINFDIVVNKLNLTAIDDDNRIAQIWGFCGYTQWKKFSQNVPQSQPGILRVIDDLNPGLSYRVSDEDMPVFVNEKTGWVCIGNPEKKGDSVEFINNCIAVIDEANEFSSLWLKPDKLPNL